MGEPYRVWEDDCISFMQTGLLHIGSENRPAGARGWTDVENTGEQPVLAFSLLPVHIEFEDHDPVVLSPATVAVTTSNGSYTRAPLNDAGQRTIFFGIPDELILGYCTNLDPEIADRPGNPFPDRYAPACPRSLALARQLERLIFESDEVIDPMFIDECSIRIIERSFDSLIIPRSARRGIEHSRATRELQRRQINHAAAELSNDPGRRWSLPDLADQIGLSPGYLSRTFRNHTGSTITHYLSVLRVAHAIQRLPESRGNLTRLAYECGFSSHAHMCTAFTKLIGVAPTTLMGTDTDELADAISRLARHRTDV